LYEPAAAEAGFKLIGNISPAPLVMGSRELISQAIANLLDNALKYAKGSEDQPNEDPTIELKVAPGPNGGTLLSIVDNGPGVSEADEKHILKRFVRLEESRSTLGNGLGLSLVSAIAQRHQAKLTIGRGLRHHPEGRKLSVHTAYGLGIRILFPPALKPSKKGLVTSVTQTQGKA
ncbi:MAG: sensor histidine kinase, partial [Pseudomonadota bacterium]